MAPFRAATSGSSSIVRRARNTPIRRGGLVAIFSVWAAQGQGICGQAFDDGSDEIAGAAETGMRASQLAFTLKVAARSHS